MNAGPPVDLATLTLDIARRELGVEEHPRGSNAGPRVNEYLAAVHMPPGAPWCAAFVCWCVREASKAMALTPRLEPAAGALRLLTLNPLLRLDKPTPGCIVVWRHADGKGHVGFVERLTGSGPQTPILLHTIEGNTNDEGGREGYEVAARVRPLKDPTIAGFLAIA